MPDGLLMKVLMIVIVLATFFLLSATILLPFFNTSYGYTVTGLSTSTTQGLSLFVLFIGFIAVIIGMIKSVAGKK